MFNNISRPGLAGAWFAAIVVAFACSVVGGAATTINAAELWLIACFVPPTVMMVVWPGDRAITVAELLYAVDPPVNDGRP